MIDIDFERLANEPAYCRVILKKLFQEDDLILLEQVIDQIHTTCSSAVAEKLLSFKSYLNLLNGADVKYQKQLIRLTEVIALKNLDYEVIMSKVMRQNLTYQLSEIVCNLIANSIVKYSEFRNCFVNDKIYRPFMSQTFLDEIKKKVEQIDSDKNVLLDWKKITTTPIDPKVKEEEIRNIYGFNAETLSREEESILGAAKILSDEKIIFEELSKLESILLIRKNEMITKGLYQSNDKDNSNTYKNYKLLSGFLYQWAEEKGFSGVAKLLKGVPPATMLNIFAEGMLFKDRALRGTYHGEWTHFLQFFILVEAYLRQLSNSKPSYFPIPPKDLLIWLGKQNNGNVLWDKTFEGDQEANDASLYKPDLDARHFKKFNNFLLSTKCKEKFPTIYECIHNRSIKKVSKSYPPDLSHEKQKFPKK